MTMLTIQLLVEGFKSDTILRFQTEQRQMPKGQAPVTQSIRKSQTQERVDLLPFPSAASTAIYNVQIRNFCIYLASIYFLEMFPFPFRNLLPRPLTFRCTDM